MLTDEAFLHTLDPKQELANIFQISKNDKKSGSCFNLIAY
jgi:hypothetical protein